MENKPFKMRYLLGKDRNRKFPIFNLNKHRKVKQYHKIKKREK